MFYLMDVVYAAGFNVTKKICMGLGQQEEEAKKFCSFDEVVNLVNQAIKMPECSGTYHDYVELCKLYDKNENGTMMLAELENILSNLGMRIYRHHLYLKKYRRRYQISHSGRNYATIYKL